LPTGQLELVAPAAVVSHGARKRGRFADDHRCAFWAGPPPGGHAQLTADRPRLHAAPRRREPYWSLPLTLVTGQAGVGPTPVREGTAIEPRPDACSSAEWG
jgi:hypothetical protein